MHWPRQTSKIVFEAALQILQHGHPSISQAETFKFCVRIGFERKNFAKERFHKL
jgi:hypothetical protein